MRIALSLKCFFSRCALLATLVSVNFITISVRAEDASAAMNDSRTIRKWTVAKLPSGRFQAARHLSLVEEERVPIDEIELGPSQVLVKIEAFSIDAFLRTLLDPGSFHYSLRVGETMRAMGFGRVLKAGSNEEYKVGSHVVGMLPVSNEAVVDKSPFLRSMQSLPGVRPSLHLGLLGNSGFSAYVGIFLASKRPPRRGDTVVISAAAGGVGNCAAQMAKLSGARVVGIAGGPRKMDFLLNELGLDAAVDYKDPTKSLEMQLAEACPNGVDFFLDNVGGEMLDAVLDKINQGARIVICGAVSHYDTGKMYSDPVGPRNYLRLAERNATMSGFVVGYYLRSKKNLIAATWYILWNYKRGKLKNFEQVENGIESFGLSLEKLLSGKNTGRLLVDTSNDYK